MCQRRSAHGRSGDSEPVGVAVEVDGRSRESAVDLRRGEKRARRLEDLVRAAQLGDLPTQCLDLGVDLRPGGWRGGARRRRRGTSSAASTG